MKISKKKSITPVSTILKKSRDPHTDQLELDLNIEIKKAITNNRALYKTNSLERLP